MMLPASAGSHSLAVIFGSLVSKGVIGCPNFTFEVETMTENRVFGEPVTDWVEPVSPKQADMHGRFSRLEPLAADLHARDLFEANCQSDLIWDYLPYGPFETVELYSDWIKSVQEKSDPFFYAVRDLASGKALGVMSYLNVSPATGSIEVGHINWSLPLQRTPAATESIHLMMKWAFEAGYRRFEWKCNALNVGSRRAAERFGFSYEGVFRQHLITKNQNRDTAWFACIDKEWSRLNDAYATWLLSDNFDEAGAQKVRLSDLTRAIRVADDPSLAG
jgi:RimJ/RimL family protein N-acetyltransferase